MKTQATQIAPRLLLAAALLAVSEVATAQVGGMVLNGSTLSYAGINTLRIGTGTQYQPDPGYIYTTTTAGNFFPLAPTWPQVQWAVTTSSACPTVLNQTFQVAKTAYYVYVDSGGAPQMIITSVPPAEDGLPSAPVWVYNNYQCEDYQAYYTFVGSYTTDASNNIIPFRRFGESVELVWNYNAANQSNPMIIFPQWNAQSVKTVLFSSNTNIVIPQSASALILEFLISWGTPDAITHTLNIFDAVLGSPPTNPQCVAGTTWGSGYFEQFLVYPWMIGTGSPIRARLTFPVGSSVTAEDCTAPWGAGVSTDLSVQYMGYIEPVHHLNY